MSSVEVPDVTMADGGYPTGPADENCIDAQDLSVSDLRESTDITTRNDYMGCTLAFARSTGDRVLTLVTRLPGGVVAFGAKPYENKWTMLINFDQAQIEHMYASVQQFIQSRVDENAPGSVFKGAEAAIRKEWGIPKGESVIVLNAGKGTTYKNGLRSTTEHTPEGMLPVNFALPIYRKKTTLANGDTIANGPWTAYMRAFVYDAAREGFIRANITDVTWGSKVDAFVEFRVGWSKNHGIHVTPTIRTLLCTELSEKSSDISESSIFGGLPLLPDLPSDVDVKTPPLHPIVADPYGTATPSLALSSELNGGE
jgi:hypothetical protein